jgi:hypothetical protein
MYRFGRVGIETGTHLEEQVVLPHDLRVLLHRLEPLGIFALTSRPKGMHSAILTVIGKCMWVLDAYSTTDDNTCINANFLGGAQWSDTFACAPATFS